MVLARCGLVLLALGGWSTCEGFRAPPRSTSRLFGHAYVAPRSAVVDEAVTQLEEPAAAPRGVPQKAVVVGAGPTGIATALMLAKRGWPSVEVFDRLPAPPAPNSSAWGDAERSYNIGVNGRGQKSLAKLGALPRLEKWSCRVKGRFDWSPQNPEGAEVVYNRTYTSMILQRDRLTSVLLEEARETYPDQIKVSHWASCEALDEDPAAGGWRLTMRTPTAGEGGAANMVEADFVVGADGVRSKVRETLEATGKLQVKRYPDKNARVYRTLRMSLPQQWRKDLNYSYRSKGGITMDALPTKEGMFLAVVLFRPGDKRIEGLRTVAEAKALFRSEFPEIQGFFKDSDLAAFVRKRTSRLPTFTVAGPELHRGGGVVVLGDAIHTVKPYFGMGANSAFEDVTALEAALDEAGDDVSQLPAALAEYSKSRSQEAAALVRMSRYLDGGFLTFILPIIVDSICNKLAPRLFAPNTIAMLQRENLSFRQVARRKRMDRAFQVILGLGLLSVATRGLFALGSGLWRARGAVGLA